MMKMSMERRAEIQMSMSDPTERKKLLRAYGVLQNTPINELLREGKLHIHRTHSGREVFIYFSSAELGIVLSQKEDELLVEDIFNRHSPLSPLNLAMAA